jgi:ATP-dependent helicase HrpB
LIELFPDRVIESSDVEWNSLASRVETFDRLTYDRLVLDETRKNGIRNAGTTRVLADAAKAAGLDFFVDREAVNQFVARVDFLRRSFPESNVPEINEPEVEEAFLRLCDGKLSFAELNDAVQSGKLLDELLSKLSAEHQRLLAKMTPLRLQLPNGRSVRINYEVGQNPWIASRIQDFFGMREGPAIAGGRVALVVHLLAPNQRPVQVTKDLSGFWQRHYPQLRKELGRRYPRHKWPEDPMRPAQ